MFQMRCRNKSCLKDCHPMIQMPANIVVCPECYEQLEVTDFVKKSLKDNNQILQKKEAKQSFSVLCKSCKNVAAPVVKKGIGYCCSCDKNLGITSAFLNAMKMKSSI